MNNSNIVEEIKNRISIVDYINQYVPLKQSGANYIGLCPFHNEKTPSFFVNESKKIFTCFGCKESGDILKFDMLYFKTTFKESLEKLAKIAGVELNYNYQNKEVEIEKEKLYEIYRIAGNEFYKNLFNKNDTRGLTYLKNRNINSNTIKNFGLGYAPNEYNKLYNFFKSKGYDDKLLLKSKLFVNKNDKIYDFFFDRVMFPILDVNGKVVAFSGRSLNTGTDIKYKYLNSSDIILSNGFKFFKKSEHIFCLHIAKKTKKNFLIVCEGNVDAIMMQQNGFDNTVACLGGAFNEIHVNALKRFTNNIILSFDNDNAGKTFTLKSIDLLKKYNFNIKVLDLSPYKDPDEFLNNLGEKEMNNRINNSVDYVIYKIDDIKSKYNTKDIQQYNQFLIDVSNVLKELNNNIIIDKYIKYISEKEELDYNELKNVIYNNINVKENKEPERLTYLQRKNIEDNKKLNDDITANYNELLLINYIIENSELINMIKPILNKEDFYNKYISIIYNDLINNIDYNSIIEKYEENNSEDNSQIVNILKVGLFNNRLNDILKHDDSNYYKAVTEIVKNIIEKSIKNQINNLGNSIENLNKLNELNLKLKNINNIKIGYD